MKNKQIMLFLGALGIVGMRVEMLKGAQGNVVAAQQQFATESEHDIPMDVWCAVVSKLPVV